MLSPLFIIIRVVLFFSFFLFTTVARSTDLYCPGVKRVEVGTPMSSRQARRMLVDAEFKDHKKINRTDKIQRVARHIKTSHSGLPQIDVDELAEIIVDVAQCTGNDFTIMAGLLKKESDYCLKTLNESSEDSSASGCGQITVWPVREFKNHLNLPGKNKPGSPNAKKALMLLLQSCFAKNPERIEEFKKVFSMHEDDVKAHLRKSGDYEIDILTAALYLKFQFGLAGFYYDAEIEDPGALSLYGEGAGYAGKVTSFAQKVDLICYDGDPDAEEIIEASCQLSDDPGACLLKFEGKEV